MASHIAALKQPTTNRTKSAPIGFSWTFFFFGSFVPLLRGDIKWFLITFILYFCTLTSSHFVFIFIYNKLYAQDLIKKGYRPMDEASKSALALADIHTDLVPTPTASPSNTPAASSTTSNTPTA